MDLISRFIDGSLMPHGQCLLWRADLLFLHIGGDILITTAYFVIPSAMIYLIKRRDDLTFNWVFTLFASFIFLCGITHLINIVNIWHGYYFIEGLFKFTTGLVSLTTAIMIWKLMPQALAIPSNNDLIQKNRELLLVEEQLLESNKLLEQRVLERTYELEKLATNDPLLNIFNRRKIMKYLSNEIKRCQRYNNTVSILMIDIDNFKCINDEYGHQIGDQALIHTSEKFKALCRNIDKIGRYGGEEFLMVLPDTDINEAETLAQRICIDIKNSHLKIENGTINITCSIGISSSEKYTNKEAPLTQESIIKSADKALYQAKNTGKNKVCITASYTE